VLKQVGRILIVQLENLLPLGGRWNNGLALSIALAKALLVMLYFMHLRYSDNLTWVFAAAAFFWVLILIGGVMDDRPGRVRCRPKGISGWNPPTLGYRVAAFSSHSEKQQSLCQSKPLFQSKTKTET
jgi:caa(3)-type oxidase subunit IV